jgi:hypothetical protein
MTTPDVNPTEEGESREVTFTRRELLRMGWTIPVVAALSVATAGTALADSYTDHTDGTHIDSSQHEDHTDFTHVDG